MAPRVRVLLFGPAREAAGRSVVERALSAGEDLGALLEALREEYPRLGPVLRSSRVAVNGTYVEKGARGLRSGDEVAIHPPFSGG